MIEAKAQNLADMSATSRLWIFQSSKIIKGELSSQVNEILVNFLANWAAHGSKVFCGFEIYFERFIVIAVDESKAPATGCSIDGLMAVIREIDQCYELDLLNRLKVAYMAADEIKECDVNAFREMLQAGSVNSETIVFNNVLEYLEQLKNVWQVPVYKSWHANLLQ